MRGKTPDWSWPRAGGRRLAVAIASFLLVAGSAQAAGTCTTATIDEPFRLPDGLLHGGGKLTLCHERNHSPVAALHEVRIDGMGVGLFVSRPYTGEELFGGSDDRPYMMFHRAGEGELVLVGVATPRRERMQLHFLDRGKRPYPAGRSDLVTLLNDPAFVVAPAHAF